MKNNSQPVIRIDGFKNPLETKKIRDFITESRIPGSNGLTAKKITVKLWGKGVVSKKESYQGSESTKYFKRKAGQFIYGKLDFLNQAFGIIPDHLDGYESTLDLPAFDISNYIDKKFFLEYVSRKQFYEFQGTMANGSRKAKRIQPEDFLEMPIILPSLEEQKQIGNLLSNLDNTITLKEQELNNLEKIRKSFYEKFFPAENETIPVARFKNFSERWVRYEFDKVIRLVGGATPSKENEDYWNGEIVWLSSQEIKNKYVSEGTYKITKKAVNDNRTKVVPKNTPLIVTRSGILAKKFPVSISLNEVAINQDIKALIYDQNMINTEFLVAQIKSKESFILKNIIKSGTTVQSVNLPDLNRMSLFIPNYEEQKKIGEFFMNIDELIDLQKQELEALKQTKQGFLQKMFV